jgi:hypothetical protein
LKGKNDLMDDVAFANSFPRHQKQALSFMLQREQGWALDGKRPDIWEMKKIGQGHLWVSDF